MKELLINKNNGGSGYLYNRLRNLRSKNRPHRVPAISEDENEVQEAMIDLNLNSSNENIQYNMDDLLFLKTTLVLDGNLMEFREKLKSTLTTRQEMLKNKKTDIKENFPCFFVRPELVKQK